MHTSGKGRGGSNLIHFDKKCIFYVFLFQVVSVFVDYKISLRGMTGDETDYKDLKSQVNLPFLEVMVDVVQEK